MKIFLNCREILFSFICISLLIPAGAITAPAFPISESGNILSAEKLTLNSPYLLSTGGRIGAVEIILNLSDHLKNGGKIVARDLTLNTPVIHNSGHIYGESGYQVRVDELTNSGTLSSPAKIDIAALHDRLHIHNSGNILARQTEVTADSLYGSGTVSGAEWAKIKLGALGGGQSVTAGEHLALDVDSDVDNRGTLGAAGQADINIPNLSNHGRILAGEVLNLNTGRLDNHADGLINTSGETGIRAKHIDNLGRIYGDWVTLAASYLKNRNGGAIAARQYLNISAAVIDNLRERIEDEAPLIKSDGSMRLGGQQLNNSGGTIQSAGVLELNGLQVKNTNPHFQTHQVRHQIAQNKKYLRSLDPGHDHKKIHDRDLFTLGRNDIFYSKDPAKTDGIKELNHVSEITADVSEERTEVLNSTPGQILVGGDLYLNQSHIDNDKSTVTIGGIIHRNGGDIANKDDIEASSQTFYDGSYRNTMQRKNKWGRRFRKGKTDRVEFGENSHDELKDSEPAEKIELNIASFNENQAPELREHDSNAGSDVGASDGGLERIESGGYITIAGIEQQLPGSKLFRSDNNNRNYHIQTDPDYIGGVVADIPAWREADGGQKGGAAPGGTAHAPTPAGGSRYDRVSANLGEHLKNRLNRINGRLGSINEQDAPQNGVTFGVDQHKIAALAPYTPEGLDPHDLQQRLGDIYAEIAAVQQQYALQSGRAQLPGEGDAIERYKALLNSGAAYLRRHNIAPGVALTAAQMKQLTGDSIILVNRSVRLADGSTRQIAVPQLYSKKRAGDIDGRHSHISGEHISGRGGKLYNRAIFHARESNTASFSEVDNRGGTISARDLQFSSDKSVDNTGGTLRARRSIDIRSGDKIINAATANAAHHSGDATINHGEKTLREGKILLDGAGQESGGYLRLYAKGDIEARAGSIENKNDGSPILISGKNIRFASQESEKHFTYNGGGQSRVGAPARDYLHDYVRRDHGSKIKGKGNILLEAREGTISGDGATIDSTAGQVALYGRDGIALKNNWRDTENSHTEHGKKSRILGSKTREAYYDLQAHRANEGSITGRTVALIAGRDISGENTNADARITLGGMHIVSDKGTLLKATGDITLNPAEETYRQSSNNYQRKSGLFYSLNNPLAINIGRRQWDKSQTVHGNGHAPGLVGALDGNIVIDSGGHYQNNGSIIHAGRLTEMEPLASKAELAAMSPEAREAYWAKRMEAGGNVIIRAKSGEDKALLGQHYQESEQTYKSRGLQIGLQGGFADHINNSVGYVGQLLGSGNERIKAMAGVLLAREAFDTVDTWKNAMGQTIGDNNPAQGGGLAQGLKLSLGYGSSHSKSHSHNNWQSVHSAQTSADGSVIVQIRGKGEASTYTNIGSDIGGGDRTVFDVEGKKTFSAIKTNQHLESNNKQWHSTIGFTAGLSSGAIPNIGVQGGGGKGHGYHTANDETLRLAHIGSLSGHTDLGEGKTHVEGAQIFGRSVSGNSRDLTIISPQGSGNERGKQYQIGGNILAGLTGVSISPNFGYGSTKGNYRTVNATSGERTAQAEGREARGAMLAEQINAGNTAYNREHALLSGQSGIYAGEDGYHINNRGTLDLQGGVILSAAGREKNYLKTDHFTYSDIENFAIGKAKGGSFGFGISFGRDQTSQLDRELNERYRKGADGKIHNEQYQKAAPNKNGNFIKFGTGTQDVHGNGAYSLAKIAAHNLLGSAGESHDERSFSRAVISDGIFEVGSAAGRENLAAVSKLNLADYHASYQPVKPADTRALKNKVDENIHLRQGMLFQDLLQPHMDDAYHSQFIAEHRLMTYALKNDGAPVRDEERIARIEQEGRNKGHDPKAYLQEKIDAGVNIYKLREVKDSERAHLGKATFIDPKTGEEVQKHAIFLNGIFNDVQAAAKYASQNYIAARGEDGKANKKVYQNVYFVHNPTADSTLGELFVAGYQKMFEGGAGGFLGLGNSTIQAGDLMKQYGKDNLYLGMHSRGTFTGHNAMTELLRNPDNIGVLAGTDIKMVGSATHVANADRQYVKLQGNVSNPRHIKIENNSHDFVGSNIGGNPKTISDKPNNKGFLGVTRDIFSSDASAHNCYGLGNQICRDTGYQKDDIMHLAIPINKLKPHKYWDMIYWQNYFLPPVYQQEENNNGVKP